MRGMQVFAVSRARLGSNISDPGPVDGYDSEVHLSSSV
jgi:hypothetical protein